MAAVVAAAVGLSGCLGTGYAYVSHRNTDHTELFFKVPSRWRFFTNKDIILAENPNISNKQLKTLEGSGWLEAFSPDPKATPKDILGNFTLKYPSGTVFARALSYSQHQTYSETSMRTEILPSDPLSDTSPDRVLSYSEFTGPSGLRGIRMTVDVPLKSGGKWITLDQVTEVDAATNWVYLLAVGCTVTCWRHYGGIATQVMNSWHVNAVK